MAAVNAADRPVHPADDRIAGCAHVVFHAPGRNGADARAATVIHPGWLDRSPCGTGTSARLAQLHARGALAVGDTLINESPIGTRFTGRIAAETTVGGRPAIVPEITGRAWVTGSGRTCSKPTIPSRRASRSERHRRRRRRHRRRGGGARTGRPRRVGAPARPRRRAPAARPASARGTWSCVRQAARTWSSTSRSPGWRSTPSRSAAGEEAARIRRKGALIVDPDAATWGRQSGAVGPPRACREGATGRRRRGEGLEPELTPAGARGEPDPRRPAVRPARDRPGAGPPPGGRRPGATTARRGGRGRRRRRRSPPPGSASRRTRSSSPPARGARRLPPGPAPVSRSSRARSSRAARGAGAGAGSRPPQGRGRLDLVSVASADAGLQLSTVAETTFDGDVLVGPSRERRGVDTARRPGAEQRAGATRRRAVPAPRPAAAARRVGRAQPWLPDGLPAIGSAPRTRMAGWPPGTRRRGRAGAGDGLARGAALRRRAAGRGPGALDPTGSAAPGRQRARRLPRARPRPRRRRSTRGPGSRSASGKGALVAPRRVVDRRAIARNDQ